MRAHVSSRLLLVFVLLIFLVLVVVFFFVLGFVVLTADMEKLLHFQHITRTWEDTNYYTELQNDNPEIRD